MDTFCERIIEMRKECGLTQKFIAKELNINEPAYQKYEYGMTRPKLSSLCKLAEIFHVSLDYLCGRTDKKVYMDTFFPKDVITPLITAIRETRKMRGLTQEEVASVLSLSTSGYQKYEIYEITPPFDKLIEIADLFELSLDESLGRKEK